MNNKPTSEGTVQRADASEVERRVRPIGGEPSKTWMDYVLYLERRNAAMVETLKKVDQVITVEAALQPNKEYGWIEWRDEHVRPWLA